MITMIFTQDDMVWILELDKEDENDKEYKKTTDFKILYCNIRNSALMNTWKKVKDY